MSWELWRQDDNGQRFLVGRFSQQTAAEERLAELSRGGHRQIYWVVSSQPAAPPLVANLFAGIPGELPAELTEQLLQHKGVRLERIVSRQHASPPGHWYDQAEDEWVLLVSGSAELEFADPPARVRLQPGDHLLLPARCRHRVAATDQRQDTVWLALFLPVTGEGHD